MATVLVEGFDHWSISEAGDKFWSAPNDSMVQGRGFGGQALKVIPNNDAWKQLPASYSEIIVGVALKIASPSPSFIPWTSTVLMILRSSGDEMAFLGLDSNQRLYIQDNAAHVIATGTTIVPFNSWFYVEFHVTVGTSGSGELHVNGASEIASTVGNFGSADVNQVLFRAASRSSTTVDDMYVADTTGPPPQNDFFGDVRIVTLYPVSDATYTDWTPKVGTDHYQMVNEAVMDGDGSYVYDANPGDIDSYLLDTFLTGTIFSAQLNIGARKGDVSLRQLQNLIRQGSTDHFGSTVTLSSSYVFYSERFDNDPDGNPWLAATINADEFGMKLIA